MSMDPRLEKLIIDLFEVNALKFGDFKMKIGVNSPVYFDLRVIVSYPKLLDLLATLVTELINKESLGNYGHICGVPYTALPIATLVSNKTQTPMLIRRREVKDYGTRKMIEGKYNKGDNCIVIDDVVTTGSSIIDTVNDLNNEDLNIYHAIVIVDREQGGKQNLKERGIKMHVLMTLSNVLTILLKAGKIASETVKEVESYISKSQINIDGTYKNVHSLERVKNRLIMPFLERAKLTKNVVAQRLFELMTKKKSILCVAADVTTSSALLDLAKQVGPHICILKTHSDIVEDFSEATKSELAKLAKSLDFLILEDRKFADIGNTVCLQYASINTWADLVTAHSLPGEFILEALRVGHGSVQNAGCFLVAQLSSQGSLTDKKYAEETAKIAEKNSDIVVGLVCQSPDIIISPHFIQLTPGVRLDMNNDHLGQSYNEPEHAVLQNGADIAVVGRGITSASDPGKVASIYRDKLWRAYRSRVGEIH